MSEDHLDKHRGMIVGRAVVAGAVSLLPVPVLDELLAGAVRETLLRRIAELRRVDVDDAAIALLADVSGGDLLRLAIDASAAALMWKSAWRRATSTLRVARRADEFAATFALATLFDHYCARHHLGMGIDLARARQLRAAIDGAVAGARKGLVRRAVRSSTALITGVPRALLHAVRPPPDAALEVVVEKSARGRTIHRAAALLESPARLWGEALARAFDADWKRGG